MFLHQTPLTAAALPVVAGRSGDGPAVAGAKRRPDSYICYIRIRAGPGRAVIRPGARTARGGLGGKRFGADLPQNPYQFGGCSIYIVAILLTEKLALWCDESARLV
jgi:hypothetical protein